MPVTATPSVGLGATISIAAAATYDVQKISPPEISVDTVETTVLASTWKTFIPTIPDGGEVSATVVFDYLDTTQAAVIALIGTGPVAVIITFKNTKTCSFSAIITKFKVNDLAVGDLTTADVTLKVTGPVTWA